MPISQECKEDKIEEESKSKDIFDRRWISDKRESLHEVEILSKIQKKNIKKELMLYFNTQKDADQDETLGKRQIEIIEAREALIYAGSQASNIIQDHKNKTIRDKFY